MEDIPISFSEYMLQQRISERYQKGCRNKTLLRAVYASNVREKYLLKVDKILSELEEEGYIIDEENSFNCLGEVFVTKEDIEEKSSIESDPFSKAGFISLDYKVIYRKREVQILTELGQQSFLPEFFNKSIPNYFLLSQRYIHLISALNHFHLDLERIARGLIHAVRTIHSLGWIQGCIHMDFIALDSDYNIKFLVIDNMRKKSDKSNSKESYLETIPYWMIKRDGFNTSCVREFSNRQSDLWSLGTLIYCIYRGYNIGCSAWKINECKTEEQFEKIKEKYRMPEDFSNIPKDIAEAIKECIRPGLIQ